jgi:Holliday junction resolvase RusA-like endonuclease
MNEIAFTIPGEPRGKGRPRFGRTKTGRPVAFTDTKTASYENLVALACQQTMAGAAPMVGPVMLLVRVRLAPPTSTSNKARAAMLDGQTPPAKRPDLDNCLKAIGDGLNGVAYVDDAQVVSLTATKIYAATAGVDVVIRPYRPEAA